MGCNCGKAKRLAQQKADLEKKLLPSQELRFDKETQQWKIVEKR